MKSESQREEEGTKHKANICIEIHSITTRKREAQSLSIRRRVQIKSIRSTYVCISWMRTLDFEPTVELLWSFVICLTHDQVLMMTWRSTLIRICFFPVTAGRASSSDHTIWMYGPEILKVLYILLYYSHILRRLTAKAGYYWWWSQRNYLEKLHKKPHLVRTSVLSMLPGTCPSPLKTKILCIL